MGCTPRAFFGCLAAVTAWCIVLVILSYNIGTLPKHSWRVGSSSSADAGVSGDGEPSGKGALNLKRRKAPKPLKPPKPPPPPTRPEAEAFPTARPGVALPPYTRGASSLAVHYSHHRSSTSHPVVLMVFRFPSLIQPEGVAPLPRDCTQRFIPLCPVFFKGDPTLS